MGDRLTIRGLFRSALVIKSDWVRCFGKLFQVRAVSRNAFLKNWRVIEPLKYIESPIAMRIRVCWWQIANVLGLC